MDKIVDFLERHVEKIVLAIVAVISAWLLVTRVVLCPNVVKYDNQNYSPGSIDDHIREQARALEDVLNSRPTPTNPYKPRLDEYRRLLRSSVKGIELGAAPAVPESNPQGGAIVRKYDLPDVGLVDDVVVGRLLAVAYTPLEEVTAERAYDAAGSEPNDLDLVTVQGAYDIAALYASFADSFTGAGVKPQWRDPCLAEPVFAAVNLQRQEKGLDGVWGQWQDVPRTRIDRRRDLFTIIEDARSLPPGGLTVRMLQYSDRIVQADLLQPPSYQIASANEEWFPPLLYDEYKQIRAAQTLEERRREKEEEKEEKSSDTSTGRRRSSSSTGGRGSLSAPSGRTTPVPGGGGRTSTGRRSVRGGAAAGTAQPQDAGRYASRNRTSRSRTGRQEDSSDALTTGRETPARPTVEDVRQKLNDMSIVSTDDLRSLEELVFWAHDDTVEPGREYRYRIRLGLFNPVAGKNQLSQRDAARNNEVILWSEFSPPSETIEIPQRIYFFAKGIQEAAKEVTVQVSKYTLGYWYSEDFKVKGGEAIGDFVENKPPKQTTDSGEEPALTAVGPSAADEPQAIDYDTGAVLVDVVPVNDFSGEATMRARQYYDMLYSYDSEHIERMPIGDRYWPEDLLIVRSEIRNSQREPRQPFRGWGAAGMIRIPTARPNSPRYE